MMEPSCQLPGAQEIENRLLKRVSKRFRERESCFNDAFAGLDELRHVSAQFSTLNANYESRNAALDQLRRASEEQREDFELEAQQKHLDLDLKRLESEIVAAKEMINAALDQHRHSAIACNEAADKIRIKWQLLKKTSPVRIIEHGHDNVVAIRNAPSQSQADPEFITLSINTSPFWSINRLWGSGKIM